MKKSRYRNKIRQSYMDDHKYVKIIVHKIDEDFYLVNSLHGNKKVGLEYSLKYSLEELIDWADDLRAYLATRKRFCLLFS